MASRQYNTVLACQLCSIDISGRHWLTRYCPPCKATVVQEQRARAEANRYSTPERTEHRRQQHRENMRQRRANPVKHAVMAAQQRQRMANPETRAKTYARAKAFRDARKDELNAKHRERMANDPEYRERRRISTLQSFYRRNTPTVQANRNARDRHRRATEPAYRTRQNARRQLRGKWDATVNRESVANLLERQRGRCANCRRNVRNVGFHLDHILPQSRGGASTIQNLQLLCARCNSSKGARLGYFRPDGQGRLALGV